MILLYFWDWLSSDEKLFSIKQYTALGRKKQWFGMFKRKSWIKDFIIVFLFLNYFLDIKRTNFKSLKIVNFAFVCRKIEIPRGLFLHDPCTIVRYYWRLFLSLVVFILWSFKSFFCCIYFLTRLQHQDCWYNIITIDLELGSTPTL